VGNSVHSNFTTAPILSKAFFSFSASSFVTFSFNTLGADSTSFFAYGKAYISKAMQHRATGRTSIKVRLGTRALTSRITFGLAAASKDSSLKLKTVFSFGFSCKTKCICLCCTFFEEKGKDEQRRVLHLLEQPRLQEVVRLSLLTRQFLGYLVVSKVKYEYGIWKADYNIEHTFSFATRSAT